MADVIPLKKWPGGIGELEPGDLIDRKFLTHAITGGFRNVLINANFQVNQLVVSGTVVLSAGQYGHDGYKAGASGCTYTFATSGGITTLTISAGSLQQVVPGSKLQTGTYVLSWAGTAQGKIGAGSYSASGVTAVVTGGVNLTVEFNTGTLSLPQLEPGATPTPFVHLPPSLDIDLCLPYFCKTFAIATAPANAAGRNGTLACAVFGGVPGFYNARWQFPVPMHATPTIQTYSHTGATGNWVDGGNTTNSAPLVADTTNSSTTIFMNGGSAYTPGAANSFYIHATASARL